MINIYKLAAYLRAKQKQIDLETSEMLRYEEKLPLPGFPEVAVLLVNPSGPESSLVYIIITFMEISDMPEAELLELVNREKCEHIIFPVFRNDNMLSMKHVLYNEPELDCATVLAVVHEGMEQLVAGIYEDFKKLTKPTIRICN